MTLQAIRTAYWLTLIGYFGLLTGLFSWHLLIYKTEAHLVSLIVLVQIGPLMFPLKGLLNGKTYTYAWSIYLAIFYFVIGVWYASNDMTLLFGLYLIATSLLFFIGTVTYTRFSSTNKT